MIRTPVDMAGIDDAETQIDHQLEVSLSEGVVKAIMQHEKTHSWRLEEHGIRPFTPSRISLLWGDYHQKTAIAR